jgi:diguanylate cyclase (GGDEF)-like protein/PAS domain S-box-containing protein
MVSEGSSMVESRGRIRDLVVLVVDGDSEMRQLMRESLDFAGVTIAEAENGAAAITEFNRVKPDLVLMSAKIPELDGLTVCSKIRQLPGGDEVTIVMVTEPDDIGAIHRSYEAGATDFITKPVNQPVLTHRVRYLLRARETLHTLRQIENRLTQVQRVARIGTWDWDFEADIFNFSDESRRIFGLVTPGGGITRERTLELVHPADRAKVSNAISRAFYDAQAFSITFRANRSDGTKCVVHLLAEPVIDDSGKQGRFRGTVQEITEREEAESQIRTLAYFDALTGLPNRERFKEQAEQAMTAAQRVGTKMALIYVDLDNFKRINDTLGHTAGDMVLKGVAKALTNIVRGTDIVAKVDAETGVSSSLARLGGDEFTIMLTGLSRSESAARVAKRIMQALSRPLKIGDREYVVTGSMGIAIYPDDGEDVNVLLRNADIAMYTAKEEGRNVYRFFSEEMNARMAERLAIESDLRMALERDELLLHYQPQVESLTGNVVAFEALVRWDHPTRGLVPPFEFIGIAEETGLIIPLGEWVLRAACEQAMKWHHAGYSELRVSVNVASQQLTQSDLVATVHNALETTGMDGRYLELELTESSLMSDVETTIQTLRNLKETGLSLSVDDFGTGYSSMNYLKRFPLDSLKIDRSFVRDLNVDPNDAAIARAVIALAKALDLSTIAEGVEEEEQLAFLRALGCDLIQGYYFGRPMPTDGIIEFLEGQAWLDENRDLENQQTEP